MGILDKLFKSRKTRPFSTWQIELTTRCSLKCTMCIKDEYKDWYRMDMDFENFKRIVPLLKDVQSVVLEGWGESLFYKHLIECILLVRQEGAEVGFVTSGMGLTEEYAKDLIAAGIDFIGFSLSGTTGGTHNAIRVNSDLDALINSMTFMKRLAAEKGMTKPAMHIVYLMLKENIHEAPSVIDLAGKIGIREVIFINIVHITNTRQDKERVFVCEETRDEPYRAILAETRKRAQRLGINLSMPPLRPCDVAVCAENPLRNLYVSADGEVSPCVYLGPPILSPFKRIFCGEEHSTERVSFGNIFRNHIDDIWNSKAYTEFRNCFHERIKFIDMLYESLTDMKPIEAVSYPDPPPPCATCHKIKGF
ncbi:MAG: pyrroloquinoline quinone biosynthesis protein PqqE [Syntrophorhabdus sp. PtaU1.Bin058]|nr:MAG: pyrroloquinoline quinone biosynthesis protein PqqE [Syntrophorhabdus sp. PtaU1.Bin058]